jgi:group I intron endonuclease
MEDFYGIIYKAVNKINGKMYIGQTTRGLEARKRQHEDCNKYTTTTKHYFQNALAKYGNDNFSWSVLDTADSEDELNELEAYYIDFFGTIFQKLGYNLVSGGKSHIPNEESRKRMSESHKGEKGYWYKRPKPPEFIEMMKNRNPSKRPEVAKKIKDSRKEYFQSERGKKFRAYISEVHKKRSPTCIWITNGEEESFIPKEIAKLKLESGEWSIGRAKGRLTGIHKGTKYIYREKITGGRETKRVNPSELEEYISKGWLLGCGFNRDMSEERRNKLSKAMKGNSSSVGRKLSDETKEKIRQSLLRRGNTIKQNKKAIDIDFQRLDELYSIFLTI